MRATVDSVISQLASLESAVSTTDNSAKPATLNADEDDILQQALKNSGLPNKNEVTPKGDCLVEIFAISYQIDYRRLMLCECYFE